MKKLSIILFATMLIFNVSAQNSCIIKCSDSFYQLVVAEALTYNKQPSNKKVNPCSCDSGDGIESLFKDETEMAMSSRKINIDEKTKFQNAHKSLKEVVIAQDGVCVIVNPSNSVSQLTREQIQSIFTGKTKNWKELGGTDMPIIVLSRKTTSGTYAFFKESALLGNAYVASALVKPSTSDVVQSVSQTKGAIGYIGSYFLDKSVKAINLSFDTGRTYVQPSVENMKSKAYLLTRSLYCYYVIDRPNSSLNDRFCNFILGTFGIKYAYSAQLK